MPVTVERSHITALVSIADSGGNSSGTKWTEWAIPALLFAATVACLWPLRNFAGFDPDEGITLEGAERILRGQLPYRDFFSFYTPGTFYLMAAVFRLFGRLLPVARTVPLLYAGGSAAITYVLARRAHARTVALFAVVMAVSCLPLQFSVLHNWDGTFFALVAIYCAHRFVEAPGNLRALALGAAGALTFLMEQSKGAGLLLGLTILFVVLFSQRVARPGWKRTHLAWGLFGLAGPLAGTVGYFAAHHAAGAMFRAWSWPLLHYTAANHTPYGWIGPDKLHKLFADPSWTVRVIVFFFSLPVVLIPLLAVLVIGSTVYWIVRRGRSSEPTRRVDSCVIGGCAFFGVWLSAVFSGRPDFFHMMQIAPLYMYLLPWFLDVADHRVRWLYGARRYVALLLLLSFAGFGASGVTKTHAAGLVPTRRGATRFAYADEAVPFIQANVAEGEHLYVYPYQPFYTFMTGVVNPTRYQFLQPGMNTPEQYQEALEDVSADKPRFVLLEVTLGGDKVANAWPGTPIEALARDPVADYIVRHYRTCRVLNSSFRYPWTFYFMLRKDLDCPGKSGLR